MADLRTTMGSMPIRLRPIAPPPSLRGRIYESLREAITSPGIYASDADLKLDERRLSERFQISRTPLREALVRLEQEGLLRIVPRKGIFIRRKTKAEILEMIVAWAALESTAARLATTAAGDEEIGSLRRMFATFDDGDEARAHIDEYSDTNIAFHQRILELSGNRQIKAIADDLFIHMGAIRAKTIGEGDRARRSVVDHHYIIEALEKRDADLAGNLVREHTMNLHAHIERHWIDSEG